MHNKVGLPKQVSSRLNFQSRNIAMVHITMVVWLHRDLETLGKMKRTAFILLGEKLN